MGRTRQIAALAALLIAAVASVASSPAEAYVEDSAAGATIELSPARPEVTAQVTFLVSTVAVEEADDLSYHIMYRPTWHGLDDGTSPPDVEVGLVNEAGEDMSSFMSPGSVHCAHPCEGRMTVMFRWIPETAADSVTVEWSANVSARFEDRSSPPDGATANATIEQPADPGMPPEPLATQTATLDDGTRVAAHRVVIDAPEGLGSGAVRLDLPDRQVGSQFPSRIIALQEGEDAFEIQPGESNEVAVPAECREGACSFAFRVLTTWDKPFLSSTVEQRWRATAGGIGSAPVIATVEAEPIPSVVGAVVGPEFAVSREEPSRAFMVEITIDSSANAPDAAIELDPLLLVTIATDADTADVRDGRFEVRARPGAVPWEPDQGEHRATFHATGPSQRELPLVVPVGCTPATECAIEVGILITSENLSRRKQVPFEWAVTAELLYPVANQVPAGAGVAVEIREVG